MNECTVLLSRCSGQQRLPNLSFLVTPCCRDTNRAVMQAVAMTACFFPPCDCKHDLTWKQRWVVKWHLVLLHSYRWGEDFWRNIGGSYFEGDSWRCEHIKMENEANFLCSSEIIKNASSLLISGQPSDSLNHRSKLFSHGCLSGRKKDFSPWGDASTAGSQLLKYRNMLSA